MNSLRRKPAKRPHGEVVGAAVVDSELLCKVVQGVKAVAGVKAFLVLPVAALYLAVVARRIGADELVADTQLGSGGLKQGGQIPLAVGKTVGELKAIVCLDTFHPDAPAGIPLDQLFQEIGGGIGGLFRVGGQEAQAGELVNGGVLEQAEFRVCDTACGEPPSHPPELAGRDRSSARRAWACKLFSSLSTGNSPSFAHDPEQALRAAGIAPLPQPVPQFHHAEVWDSGGACPGSASAPPLCAGWDGCGAAGTGRPGIPRVPSQRAFQK